MAFLLSHSPSVRNECATLGFVILSFSDQHRVDHDLWNLSQKKKKHRELTSLLAGYFLYFLLDLMGKIFLRGFKEIPVPS